MPHFVTFDISIRCLCFVGYLFAALVSGVGLGFANPTIGCLADKYSFTKISTCGIFVISGDSIML